ncbi:hypothetical protein [Hydrogenimonas sp.]
MKFLWSIVILLLLLFGATYALLFTKPGNDLLKPLIESKIAANVPLPTKLERFTLRPNRFDMALKIGKDSLIEAKGTMNLFSQSVNGNYRVQIQELSNLQKLIGQKLNGPFHTQGTIEGNKMVMHIDGSSDIAGSSTEYHLALREFRPENLVATIEHMQIDKLLHMVNQPIYAKGIVNIEAKIPRMDIKNLKGDIVTAIRKGRVHPAPIKRDFNLSIPSNLTFAADIKTRLAQTKAISDTNLRTSIAKLLAKTLTYDIAKGSLATDYILNIPNMDRLYFLTGQHMKGAMKITGDIKSSKNHILATAHSDTLGGAFDALYKNGKADIKIKNIQTVALTDMLLYPHIFDSRANAKITYDTLRKKGTMHAELLDGQILPNKMSFLLKQMANFDITKEIYERTTIDTDIDDKRLTSDLYMKSRLTEITSRQGVIDLDEKRIDTTLNIKIRKMWIPVHLTGELTKPNIKIDTRGLMKSKVKEEIKKRLPIKLKDSPVGDLIKNLF